MPALTFRVSVSFCFANSFAWGSLRNVSVDREKARFAGRILYCSNETYQVSWGLTAMGVLAGNEIASSFRSPAATRHRMDEERGGGDGRREFGLSCRHPDDVALDRNIASISPSLF